MQEIINKSYEKVEFGIKMESEKMMMLIRHDSILLVEINEEILFFWKK